MHPSTLSEYIPMVKYAYGSACNSRATAIIYPWSSVTSSAKKGTALGDTTEPIHKTSDASIANGTTGSTSTLAKVPISGKVPIDHERSGVRMSSMEIVAATIARNSNVVGIARKKSIIIGVTTIIAKVAKNEN